MAGILTHLVYAQKKDPDNIDFIKGVTLADIDYLRVVDRSRTHLDLLNYDNDPKAEIRKLKGELSPFASRDVLKGIVFHSLTEKQWAHGIWVDSDSRYFSKALKLWCDELLWPYIQDKDFIVSTLEHNNDNSLLKSVQLDDQKRWFSVVSSYVQSRPSNKVRTELAREIKMPSEVIQEINEVISTQLVHNKTVEKQLLENYHTSTSFILDTPLEDI